VGRHGYGVGPLAGVSLAPCGIDWRAGRRGGQSQSERLDIGVGDVGVGQKDMLPALLGQGERALGIGAQKDAISAVRVVDEQS